MQDAVDVARWARRLGITPEQLQRAVRQVGPMVENLRRYLGKSDAALPPVTKLPYL